MTLELLQDKLAAQNLQPFYDQLKPEIQTAIRLSLTHQAPDRLGASRIGGKPDLPPTLDWPLAQHTIRKKTYFGLGPSQTQTVHQPMPFIAQLNMKDFAEYNVTSGLPGSGILYFFYDAEQSAWGFDQKDKSKFKVCYFTGPTTDLQKHDFPEQLPETGRFKSAGIEAKPEISLPGVEHKVYETLSEDQQDWFFDTFFPDEEINKIGGHTDTIQNEMKLECELVTNGVYCGDPSGYQHPKAKKLAANTKNWQLLLQIDSIDSLEMMWGDAGRLYFWIKKEDLISSNFDQCWLILQCY